MTGPQFAFFEGKIVPIAEAKISIMTHALNYGTAAFGGIRAYWNPDLTQLYLFRPLDHFTRLKQSAALLMIDLPYSPEWLCEILTDLLSLEAYHEDVYVRPLVYKSETGIGVRMHDLKDDFCIFALPFGQYLAHEEGLSVCFSSWRRIDDNMIPARGKISGAYVNSALIKTEASLNGFDDGLVLDQDGHVAEASAANFFMVRNGKVITPPTYGNILEGITRRTVWTLLTEEFDLQVEERPIDRTEVYSAEEAFLCGTGVQIAAITSIDHRPIGCGVMGPVVHRLRQLYFDIVRGKVERYAHWIDPVYTSEPSFAWH